MILLCGAAGYIAFLELQTSTASSTTAVSSLTSNSTAPSSSESTTPQNATLIRAVDYLIDGYNPDVGLIPETPGSSTYWLYSDNFLAAQALLQYGKSNNTVFDIGQNISKTLQRDSAGIGAENQYAMALGEGPCQFHSAVDYNVSSSGGIQIRTTLNNEAGNLSANQYADIAFLTAICLHTNQPQALAEYDVGQGMFDGIGLRDLPYNQSELYQTYKLALYIYASDILSQPVNQTALATLIRMQAPNGGFYTGYDPTYSPAGTLTNTETTSLAILALYNYLQK